MLRKANQASGQAFGLRGRHVVRLDDGLRLALRRTPQMFRVIALHELAHIVNRDVGRTYFAQALWSATLWLAIIPYLVVLVVYKLIGSRVALVLQGGLTDTDLQRLLATSLPSFLLLLLQLMAGAIMAYCIRASLLRAGKPTRTGVQHRGVQNNRWERSFSAVPRQGDQQKQGSEPGLLGVLSKAPAYLLSIIENAMSTASDIGYQLLLMLGWLSLVVAVFLALAPLIAVCVMVMGSLGLEVLRETIRDLQLDRHGFRGYGRLLMPAVLLVLGLYLGIMTGPDAYMLSAGPAVLRLSFIQLLLASAFVLIPGSLMALLICGVGFPVGWVVTAIWRRLWPSRCPQCHAIARQTHVIGKICDQCGAELALWLFVSYGGNAHGDRYA